MAESLSTYSLTTLIRSQLPRLLCCLDTKGERTDVYGSEDLYWHSLYGGVTGRSWSKLGFTEDKTTTYVKRLKIVVFQLSDFRVVDVIKIKIVRIFRGDS